MPNIKIGIGAVVTKDVGDYSVVVGSPAKYMRKNTPVFSQALLNHLSD